MKKCRRSRTAAQARLLSGSQSQKISGVQLVLRTQSGALLAALPT